MKSYSGSRKAILLLSVLGLTGLLVWQLDLTGSKVDVIAAVAPAEFMTDIRLKQFTGEGMLAHQLNAKHWAYHTIDRLSLFTRPFLEIRRNGRIWTIVADYGQAQHNVVTQQPDLIKLSNHVVIKKLAYQTEPETELTTESLNYHTNTKLIETRDQVTVNKPGLTVTGRGMHANMDKGQIELLNDVETRYFHHLDP